MSILRHFWATYCRRYRGWYAVGVACLVATNVLTVAIPDFVRRAVDALDGDLPGVATHWAWAILAAGLGIMGVRTLSRTAIFNPGRTIEFNVKAGLFDRLLRLPRTFYDRMRPGEIISRGTNDTNSMRALVGFATLQLFNVVLVLSFTLGRMIWMDARLTAIVVSPLILSVIVLRYAVRAMFRLMRELQAQIATLSDRILETYNGVAALRAFNALPGADARFDEANDRLLELGLALMRVRAWLLPVVSVVGNLCVVLLLYVGGRRVVHRTLTLGELAAFAVYINIVVAGLTGLGWMVSATQRGWIGLRRVYDVLDAPLERTGSRVALAPPSTAGAGYGLSVRDLSFTYPAQDGRGPVLHGLSFDIAPGETVGIFGLTGSGKSTLLQLLARIYDPPPGTIRLDGTDIVDLPVEAYWRALAYVGQEPYLFSRSVRENIAVAAEPGAIDEARLLAALDDAALAGDLDALPDGVDTRVGERGITLSGGQRQRTALARAFYRDYELLLLDDVLSAVDHATEKRLIDAIYRRAGGGTTVIVSHRVSVLQRADRVLVLDAGRLVAEGTHEALLGDPDGVYARAWRLQRAADALEDDPPAETRHA